jgi:hypothetical protein
LLGPLCRVELDDDDIAAADVHRLPLGSITEVLVGLARHTVHLLREGFGFRCASSVPLSEFLARHRFFDGDFPVLFVNQYLVSAADAQLLSQFFRESDLPSLTDLPFLAPGNIYSYFIHIYMFFPRRSGGVRRATGDVRNFCSGCE